MLCRSPAMPAYTILQSMLVPILQLVEATGFLCIVISTKALNQHPNLQPIKITLDSSSQIRQTDKPLDDLTYDRVADIPFSDEGLGTDYDTVEQNFDPTHLANNDNKQFPRLIHTQNSNDDPNDQIYNRDDLQVEPYSSMRANFRTNDKSQHDPWRYSQGVVQR